MEHITAAQLIELDFKLTASVQMPDKTVTRWGGHRLLVEHSKSHIRVKMQGCGCPLVTAPAYSFEKMSALLDGLKMN